MVGHLLEYHPAVLKLWELINTGELGKINYIYSNRLNFGKVRTEENALWSFAPHDVAVILRLLGQSPLRYLQVAVPTLIKALLMSPFQPSIFRRFPCTYFCKLVTPHKEQRLVVVGDKKMAIFNDLNPFGEKLCIYPQTVEFDGNFPILKRKMLNLSSMLILSLFVKNVPIFWNA